MLGLSTLGAVHTAIALVAVICGFALTLRFGRIGTDLPFGPTYVASTALAALTAFGLFRHGGFNIAHALAALTLAVLFVAAAAGRWRQRSRIAAGVEAVGFSLTLFFHMIPGLTETFTRLPLGAPLFTGPDDPVLQRCIGALLFVLIVGAALQIRRVARRPAPAREHWFAESDVGAV